MLCQGSYVEHALLRQWSWSRRHHAASWHQLPVLHAGRHEHHVTFDFVITSSTKATNVESSACDAPNARLNYSMAATSPATSM
eukprot:608024-Pelagomonas_calceolata.AAC.3